VTLHRRPRFAVGVPSSPIAGSGDEKMGAPQSPRLSSAPRNR
jgi:hypothetical protein